MKSSSNERLQKNLKEIYDAIEDAANKGKIRVSSVPIHNDSHNCIITNFLRKRGFYVEEHYYNNKRTLTIQWNVSHNDNICDANDGKGTWTNIGGDLEARFDGFNYVDIRTRNQKTRLFMSEDCLYAALDLFKKEEIETE